MNLATILSLVGLAISILGLAVFVGRVLERQDATDKKVDKLQRLFNLESKDGPTFVHASQFQTHLQIEREHRSQYREMIDELKSSLKSLEDKFDKLSASLLRAVSSHASSEKNE